MSTATEVNRKVSTRSQLIAAGLSLGDRVWCESLATFGTIVDAAVVDDYLMVMVRYRDGTGCALAVACSRFEITRA